MKSILISVSQQNGKYAINSVPLDLILEIGLNIAA